MRFFLIYLVLFLYGSSIAQNKSELVISGSFLNTRFYQASKPSGEIKVLSKSTLGFAFGLGIEHQVRKWLYLESGISLSLQGEDYVIENYPQTSSNCFLPNQTLHLFVDISYLKIPFQFKWCYEATKKLSLILITGAQYSYRVGISDNYQDLMFCTVLLPEAKRRYENSDWGLIGGIGIKRKLKDYNVKLDLNIFFDWGMKNIVEYKDPVIWSNTKVINQVWGLHVGAIIPLQKQEL